MLAETSRSGKFLLGNTLQLEPEVRDGSVIGIPFSPYYIAVREECPVPLESLYTAERTFLVQIALKKDTVRRDPP
jgi:hypothetical protein